MSQISYNLVVLSIGLAFLAFYFVNCNRCTLEDRFEYCSFVVPRKQGFWSPSVMFCYDKCVRSNTCLAFHYEVNQGASKRERSRCALYRTDNNFTVLKANVCNNALYSYTWKKPMYFNLQDVLCSRDV